MIIAATSRRKLHVPGFRRKGQRFAHKMVYVAAAAAFSTSSHAWMVTTDVSRRHSQQLHPIGNYINFDDKRQPCIFPTFTTTTTTTRLYSSSNRKKRISGSSGSDDDNDNKNTNELFGFRRAAKKAARKVLPTKWFGTKEEKEALERKQMVKDRVRGELDQMLKGAPLPIKMFAKYVAAPMMGKMASKMAEMGLEQQKAMENILDEARDLLMRDAQITDLLGTPIQIGTPFSQQSSTTVINGRRQMRTEFAVELSGPYENGVCRIVATNEGVGQLLVEANGRIYNVDLTSEGRMSSSSSSSSSSRKSPSDSFGNNDDNIIEAEIIDKETK
eukprot:CAMPEP_0116156694 /NCGR_PEP_ID=MMETSP0329-20121206/22964_1 /TAXON_ID=697910 /ORGANISM="Pseudo-nitzschia arenysensis, Strain B593" /LENGTH=329 /DNA_ID=CAMNT_0003653785 /DNA_START=196 /DNA_END=1188 /DNA_ORIENTATION=-